jgi:Methyltransferase domain
VRRTSKPKAELVPGQSEALLRELHLVSRDGKLHADSLRKLKQVNHLAQLIAPALQDIAARFPSPQLLDAGAGNAYLGFVLYELFLREGEAVLWSVETRPELVERARVRAAGLGFDRMRFVAQTLREASQPVTATAAVPAAPEAAGATQEAAATQRAAAVTQAAAAAPAQVPLPSTGQLPERLHLVTALHACDTATDDALALAIRRRADHVAVVPCCQAEVAAQLKERPPAEGAWPQLWSHPIHRREFGAHLTNVLRALVLEAHGYQVTVTELTGWEHSLKNELILGRRVHNEHAGARARLRELLAATGVRPQLVRELLPALLAARGAERTAAT